MQPLPWKVFNRLFKVSEHLHNIFMTDHRDDEMGWDAGELADRIDEFLIKYSERVKE